MDAGDDVDARDEGAQLTRKKAARGVITLSARDTLELLEQSPGGSLNVGERFVAGLRVGAPLGRTEVDVERIGIAFGEREGEADVRLGGVPARIGRRRRARRALREQKAAADDSGPNSTGMNWLPLFPEAASQRLRLARARGPCCRREFS
jgi:hypothetical protein